MLKIGVLSYQGSVIEHLDSLSRIKGVIPMPVKYSKELNEIDGLILPGGESTAISNLLRNFGTDKIIRDRIADGMPVWGTCAGLILLAKDVVGQQAYLQVMDISAKRNAYGTQLDSFETNAAIEAIDKNPIPLVFIRAPYIESVGKNVEILFKLNGNIVAAKQKNMLVTSFHPELTKSLAFHKYFVSIAEDAKKSR